MNTTSLIGRLTKEPDTRTSKSGTKVARFSLAVDRFGEGADFIPCVAFGKTADFVEKYLAKGMKIAVIGRIQTGSYQNREGKTVYTFDVVAERCEFCEKKQAPEEAPDDFMEVPEDVDDEVPFA